MAYYLIHLAIVLFFFLLLLCWGLTTSQPLWVILCRLPVKGRKDIEKIVQEIKEKDREERRTGMKAGITQL